MIPPAPGQSAKSVRAELQTLVDRTKSLKCDVEMSEKSQKKDKRKIKTGPMEILRGEGARIKLTRKDNTKEYIANKETLWSCDYKDKEAQYIPTTVPVIDGYVAHAMNLNVFMSVDEETLQLVGSQEFEAEPCWVLQGMSPSKLSALGVPVEKIRVWISKEDGMPRKIAIPKENDLTIIMRNIRVNEPIQKERFQFIPPKGMVAKNIFGF